MGILNSNDQEKIDLLIFATKESFDSILSLTLSLEEAAKELNRTKEGLRYTLKKYYKGLFIRVPFHQHRPYRIPKLLIENIKKNK